MDSQIPKVMKAFLYFCNEKNAENKFKMDKCYLPRPRSANN